MDAIPGLVFDTAKEDVALRRSIPRQLLMVSVGGTQGIMVHPGDLSGRKSSVRPSFSIFKSVKLGIVVELPCGGPVLLLQL